MINLGLEKLEEQSKLKDESNNKQYPIPRFPSQAEIEGWKSLPHYENEEGQAVQEEDTLTF